MSAAASRRAVLQALALGTAGFALPSWSEASLSTVGGTAAELPPALRVRVVQSRSMLQSAVATARPGDHIVLAAGVYTGDALSVGASGTAPFPIVIRAASLLGSEVRFPITLAGDRIILWGVRFSGESGKVAVTGHHDSVLRCAFAGWGAGNAVRLGHGGSHGQVRYCRFDTPGPWTEAELAGASHGMRLGIRVVGRRTTFHRNARITHCLFGRTLARPIPGRYDSGQTDWIEVGENGAYYRGVYADATIEKCLFDGHPDPNASGVLDIKISGVTVRQCTFQNAPTGRLDIRYGEGCRLIANYFRRTAAGLAVAGARHVVAGNVCEPGSRLRILAGTMDWHEYVGTGRQRAQDVRLVGNEGLLVIGDRLGTPTAVFPADGTRIEGHRATILTQRPYAGRWAQPARNLLEQNTTYSAATAESLEPAVALGPDEVGPSARWVG